MRFNTRIYIKALLDALEKKEDEKKREILRRFLIILRKNRDLAKLNLILRGVEKEYLKRTNLKKINIEAAAKIKDPLRQKVLNIFGRKSLLIEKTNPELLAGIKIIVDNELLIDASGKKLIDTLFKT